MFRTKGYPAAIAEFQRIYDLGAKTLGIAGMGQAYAASGNRIEAQKALAQLQELSKQRYVMPDFFALIYAALGDKDQAFAWLEKCVEEHDLITARLKVDARFDRLRSDPRFADLVRRVGLPP